MALKPVNSKVPYSPERKKLGNHDAPWQEERPREEMLEDFAGFVPAVVEMIKAIPKPSIWGIL